MADEFDDDTEAPLEAPLSSGSGASAGPSPEQMAMMQQMMQQQLGGQRAPAASGPSSHVVRDGEEDGPHKHWTSVYPIYLDAKRRYRHGCRRVPYAKAVLFPNSQYLSNAAKKLGLEYRHEDWENPGRIKVRLFHEDGSPIRAELPTSMYCTLTSGQSLLVALAELLQPFAGGAPPALKDRGQASKKSSKAALRPRQRMIRGSAHPEQLPPHSPAVATGLLNMDMAKMPGMDALKSMGPLGAMMSNMGLMGDDEEAETPQAPQARAPPALGRRQRKRVVRIGR